MRRMLLAMTLVAVGAAAAWAQFYGSMPNEQRKVLAEDYYLAANQYAASGDGEKAEAFQELAYQMYPGLDPKSIHEVERPSAAELLAKSSIPVAGPPEADAVTGLVRSRLLRFIGAMLTEDAEAAVASFDGSLYFTQARFELSRAAAFRQLQGLFDKVSLRGILPSQLYRLETLSIAKAPELSSQGWGTVYTAEVDTRMDLTAELPVWTPRQRFYLRSSGGTWLIFAVGDAAPPAGWMPAAPTAVAAAPAASAQDDRPLIEAAFMDCVARFLQKDAEGALRYFAQRVRIERLGATVARNELGKAFETYFAAMSQGVMKTEELVEPQSVFVTETDRFADLATGPRYVLTVKTRVDLAETIPFWTRFQEYYFTVADGSWKIFAIF